jgi:hypothetical protein
LTFELSIILSGKDRMAGPVWRGFVAEFGQELHFPDIIKETIIGQ